jgi:hypothetical protein
MSKDIKAEIQRVADNAADWRALKFGEKAALLRACLQCLGEENPELSVGNIAKAIQGVEKLGCGVGGESDSKMRTFMFFDFSYGRLKSLIKLLDSLESTGKPPQPVSVEKDKFSGATVAHVFPSTSEDKSSMAGGAGLRGEVWLKVSSDEGNPILGKFASFGRYQILVTTMDIR